MPRGQSGAVRKKANSTERSGGVPTEDTTVVEQSLQCCDEAELLEVVQFEGVPFQSGVHEVVTQPTDPISLTFNESVTPDITHIENPSTYRHPHAMTPPTTKRQDQVHLSNNNNNPTTGSTAAADLNTASNPSPVSPPPYTERSFDELKFQRRDRSPSCFVLCEDEQKTPLEKNVFDEEIPAPEIPLEFKFSQVKGTNDDEVSDADIISTVQFNENGNLLATGDKGGRIVIFKRDNQNTSEYNVYSTFQSHEPEFDYLKSVEIEEKINKIRWLPQRTSSHFLLSTNDKTVKMWKISERQSKVQGWNTQKGDEDAPYDSDSGLRNQSQEIMDTSDNIATNFSTRITRLNVPKVVPSELCIESYPKKIFSNAHAYHINSISCNSDAMTFLSADDLRINVWNLETITSSFNVVDIKPTNMEDLSEVITSAEYHPHHCHLFAYSSSRGAIKLCDMRQSALCDNHRLVFEQEENPQDRSFFSEIIASVSDIAFSPCGRYILSRDYLTVKLWDLVNTGRGPVKSYPVHPFLSQRLCTLYENDCIFDKFEVCWSHDASNYMTGSYNNLFRVGNIDDNNNTCHRYQNDPCGMSNLYQAYIDAADLPTRRNEQIRPILAPKKIITNNPLAKKKRHEICVDHLDYRQKVLHSAWHPSEHILAVAATNRLLIYDSKVAQ